ncbi:methyltransferase-like protein 25B isoform X2 [Oratosquilla oratoria]|uniref:methyltransferase-like protein 25B isoform X2 n=1 Tax=Oratosquilla oratoria TaxID=337810 RepID=UPI003F772863
MSYIRINDENITAWKEFMENAIKLLNMYRNILDTYVLDFFVEDFWNRMNQSWQKVLSDATPQFLANIITSLPCRSEHVLPLSLLAFRASTFTFSLARSPVRSPQVFQDFLLSSRTVRQANICSKTSSHDKPCFRENHTHIDSESSCDSNIFKERTTDTGAIDEKRKRNETITTPGQEVQEEGRAVEDSVDAQIRNLARKLTLWGDATNELSIAAGQHAHLHHAFRRHVKPKKQHEAARLATVAAMVSHATDTVLVDVGSGQGHLSRLLAYGLGTRVLCLDAQEQFTLGARKFDAQLEACMRGKGLSKSAGSHIIPPQALPHPPRHVTLTLHPDMDTNHLLQVLQEAYSSPAQHHTEKKFETSEQELKQVQTSELEQRRITNNQTMTSHQTQREPEPEINKERNSKLTSFGLLGLHTCGDLAPTMIRLFVRSYECCALISVGCCYMKMNTSGDGYAQTAIARLPDVTFMDEDLDNERVKEMLDRWMQVVVFYSIRLMLAPVVESVVLLDRLMYLYEQGYEALLVPLFDPSLSPRNFALLTVKNLK